MKPPTPVAFLGPIFGLVVCGGSAKADEPRCRADGAYGTGPGKMVEVVPITFAVREPTAVLAGKKRKDRRKWVMPSDADMFLSTARTLVNLGYEIRDRDAAIGSIVTMPVRGGAIRFVCVTDGGEDREVVLYRQYAVTAVASREKVVVGLNCQERWRLSDEWGDCASAIAGASNASIPESVAELAVWEAIFRANP